MDSAACASGCDSEDSALFIPVPERSQSPLLDPQSVTNRPILSAVAHSEAAGDGVMSSGARKGMGDERKSASLESSESNASGESGDGGHDSQADESNTPAEALRGSGEGPRTPIRTVVGTDRSPNPTETKSLEKCRHPSEQDTPLSLKIHDETTPAIEDIMDRENGIDDIPAADQDEVYDLTTGVADGADFEVPPFVMDDYDTMYLQVRIAAVREGPNPIREPDPAHVQDIKKQIIASRYLPGPGGCISIAIPRSQNPNIDKPVQEFFNQMQDVSDYTVIIIDGRHRKLAIVDCLRTHPGRVPVNGILQVSIVFRRDGADLTQTEMVKWSSIANGINTTVLVDNEFIPMARMLTAYAAAFLSEHGRPCHEMKMSHYAMDMENARYLGKRASEATTARFYMRAARLGQLLSRVPGAYARLRACNEHTIEQSRLDADAKRRRVTTKAVTKGMLVLSYFDTAAYRTLDEHDVYLFFDAVTQHVLHPQRKGTFNARRFYEYIGVLREEFEKLHHTFRPEASKEAFYGEVFPMGGAERTVREKFCQAAALFDSAPNPSSNANRIDTNVSLLRKLYQPDPTPVKKKTTKKKTGGKKRKARATTAASTTASASASTRTPAAGAAAVVTRQRRKDLVTTTAGPSQAAASLRRSARNRPREGAPHDATSSDDAASVGADGRRRARVFDDRAAGVEPPPGYVEVPAYEAEVTPEWTPVALLPRGAAQLRSTLGRDEHGDVRAYLHALHIPAEHRAKHFLDVNQVRDLIDLSWIWAKFFDELLVLPEPRDEIKHEVYQERWDRIRGSTQPHAGMFFLRHREHMTSRGWTVMVGIADPYLYQRRHLDENSRKLWQVPVADLFRFWDQQFTNSIASGDTHDWAPIYNTGNTDDDYRNDARFAGRFTSTLAFLFDSCESDARIRYQQVRVGLEVWLATLFAQMRLANGPGQPQLFIPRTGSRVLVTGTGCERQASHNDYPLRTTGYFVVLTGPEESPLWVSDMSHAAVWYDKQVRTRLKHEQQMKKIIIPPYSVFFGHGHTTHAGGASRDGNGRCIRMHCYISEKSFEVVDQIFFLFDDKVPCDETGVLAVPAPHMSYAAPAGGSGTPGGGEEQQPPPPERREDDPDLTGGHKTAGSEKEAEQGGDMTGTGEEAPENGVITLNPALQPTQDNANVFEHPSPTDQDILDEFTLL